MAFLVPRAPAHATHATQAECREWSINEIVFSAAMWKMRGPGAVSRAGVASRCVLDARRGVDR